MHKSARDGIERAAGRYDRWERFECEAASSAPSTRTGAHTMQRRDFLSLAAVGGGAVFASGLAGCASRAEGMASAYADFYFVQLSDSHWGFQGPANPDAAVTLRKTVA